MRSPRSKPAPSILSARADLPAVSVAQMQQIDTTAMSTFGIPRLLLMNHAGLALAQAVRQILPTPHASLVIICGNGYNGGDGLCAAWYLARWKYRLSVVLTSRVEHLQEEPAVFARIAQALEIPMTIVQTPAEVEQSRAIIQRSDAIVDALLGIGVQGDVRPLQAALIHCMNQAGKPIIAADVPSGLDADTGLPRGVAVRATVTVTFGLPKQGFTRGLGPAHVGQLFVDDIGLPSHLLRSA